MARDIDGDYPNIKSQLIFSDSAQGFQNMVLSNLREAVTNSSLFYCASKQYGDADDISSAWSTYIRVRDLYEEIMQNFIV